MKKRKLNKQALSKRLLKLIKLEFGGCQSTFAKHIDVTPEAVNVVTRGKIKVPHKKIMDYMVWNKVVPDVYIEG